MVQQHNLPKLEEFPALMAQSNEAASTPNSDAVAVQLPDALPADEAEKRLQEVVAQSNTKMDIEQLEKENQQPEVFMEPDQLGESSGQSRLMGEEGSSLSPSA
jgi:hypothetical protein